MFVANFRVRIALSTAAAVCIGVCALPVAAAVTERPLFGPDAHVNLNHSFVHQGQLWVVGDEPIPPDYSRAKSAAYVLDNDRGLIEKFEIPEGLIELTPWQRGFMAVRKSNKASGRAPVHIQQLDQRGRAVKAPYVFNTLSYSDLRLQPGTEDGELFVGESILEGGVLRAIGADRQLKWERTIDRRVADIELTDRGLAVLTEPASNGSAGSSMIMYSGTGQLLWRARPLRTAGRRTP